LINVPPKMIRISRPQGIGCEVGSIELRFDEF
jgi:hypothetical protein